MVIDLAGLFASAVLLITLVALEVRRAGPDTAQPAARQRLLAPAASRRIVAVMWAMYLLLFLPRVLGLLT